MPLIQKIASYLWVHKRGKVAPTYCVGMLGNSHIRAVAHYGKTGFEVSWQIVPAGRGDGAASGDRVATARQQTRKLDHAVLQRVAGGSVA